MVDGIIYVCTENILQYEEIKLYNNNDCCVSVFYVVFTFLLSLLVLLLLFFSPGACAISNFLYYFHIALSLCAVL